MVRHSPLAWVLAKSRKFLYRIAFDKRKRFTATTTKIDFSSLFNAILTTTLCVYHNLEYDTRHSHLTWNNFKFPLDDILPAIFPFSCSTRDAPSTQFPFKIFAAIHRALSDHLIHTESEHIPQLQYHNVVARNWYAFD